MVLRGFMDPSGLVKNKQSRHCSYIHIYVPVGELLKVEKIYTKISMIADLECSRYLSC